VILSFKKPTETQMTAKSCLKHDELPFEYFCVDHDVICCKECLVESKGAKRSQSFIDSFQLIEQVSETVNEFTKDRREHIEIIDDTYNWHL
jgi:predicted metal-binding protein